jgi:hypothetical protein
MSRPGAMLRMAAARLDFDIALLKEARNSDYKAAV